MGNSFDSRTEHIVKYQQRKRFKHEKEYIHVQWFKHT